MFQRIAKGFLGVILAAGFGATQSFADGAPGLKFTELMSGAVQTERGSEKVDVKFTATIENAEAWYSDIHHLATLEGQVKIDGKKYPAHGTLEMMTAVSPTPGEKGHYLTYHFTIDDDSAPFASFEGAKRVYNDHKLDLIADATTLHGKFRGGDCNCSHPATLKFHWENPWVALRFFLSFKALNAGPVDSVAVMYKFMRIWLGGIYEEFFKSMAERDLSEDTANF